jgi:predicted secreted Zn-dependent protease
MAAHPAAYPFRVNKVQISGTCFGGQEIWSTGFYLGLPGANAPDPGTATAQAVAGHWQTFFTNPTSAINQGFKTLHVKVSQLELDGDVDLDMINIYDYPSQITGTNNGPPQAPQVSLAVTLTSDLQRGLAAKGRMYLPGINLPVFHDNPHISLTEQNGIATTLKTFFDGVNADSNIGGNVVLASKGRKVKTADPKVYSYENGVIQNMTGLRLGNVYDTQRRRRNDIVETYVSRVLA